MLLDRRTTMTTKMTDIEVREDRRRKTLLYDHPSTMRERAERNRKPDETDAMRRRHSEQRGELAAKSRQESGDLERQHRAELYRHDSTRAAKPVELLKKHKEERDSLDKQHRQARERMDREQRLERDRLPK
jgi:hypothetical protein